MKNLDNLSLEELERKYKYSQQETAEILLEYNKRLAKKESELHYLPDILTVAQVAKYLQISRPQVYKLIELKRLKSGKLETQVRIKKPDLEAYIKRSFNMISAKEFEMNYSKLLSVDSPQLTLCSKFKRVAIFSFAD